MINLNTSKVFNYILAGMVLVIILGGIYIYKTVYQTQVYACSEVTKDDPMDVLQLCSQLKRIYE